jgi:hypothetical protein
MTRVIVLAAAAALLAGCGHAPPPAAKLLAPAVAAPTVALTAPKPVNGLDWRLTVEGDHARLAYGASPADTGHLTLTCAQRSGKITLDRPVAADQAGTPSVLVLGSGSARGRWLATQGPGDQAGRVDLQASVSANDPAIDAFLRNGWVTAINTDGKTEGMAPQPGQTNVRQFFDYCG